LNILNITKRIATGRKYIYLAPKKHDQISEDLFSDDDDDESVNDSETDKTYEEIMHDDEIKEIENPTKNKNSSISFFQKNHTTSSNDAFNNNNYPITNDNLSSINSLTNYPTYSIIDHSNSSNVDFSSRSTSSNIGSNNYSTRTNIINIDDNDDTDNINEDYGITFLFLNNEYNIIFANVINTRKLSRMSELGNILHNELKKYYDAKKIETRIEIDSYDLISEALFRWASTATKMDIFQNPYFIVKSEE
jgi:hypothetical protein